MDQIVTNARPGPCRPRRSALRRDLRRASCRATRCSPTCRAQVRERVLHASRPDAGGGAAAPGLVAMRWATCWASRAPTRPRARPPQVLARQPRAARHAALRRALRRAPVRPLGGAARRRPRHHAGRSAGARRRALRAAAEGRRPDALLAHRRRPRGAALLACANSCAARRCTTSACRRRARCRLVATGEAVMRDMFYDGHPQAEPGADRVPRRAVVRALRQLRDPRRAPASTTSLRAARRLRDPSSLPGSSSGRRASPRRLRCAGSRRSAGARRA